MTNQANALIAQHYEAHFDTLVQKLTFRCGTVWDAEDAIQDAYERALKYFDSFDADRSTFGQWFNRIILNAIKDHLRANKGIADIEFDEELADGTPCQQYSDKVLDEIKQRIAERKPHIAEILKLFFFNGYTAKDISTMVESSHLVVNQTIFRFRLELKRDYKDGGSL